jgi:D-glycero-D-manno-heptose 1,7-bisphosphate phosphatase
MHRRMLQALSAQGATVDAVYYCPHDHQPACQCRKPEPGMILEAAQAWSINLKASWMIGDSASDIEAGRRAGCKTVYISGKTAELPISADFTLTSLLEAVRKILALEQSHSGASALTPAYSENQR